MTARSPNGRVVVGIDGSPEARAVALYALDLARERHCDLALAHAWPFPWAAGYFNADDVAAARRDADHLLRSVLDSLPIPDGMHVDVVTAQEPIASFLHRLSESARLLVVGRHSFWSERGLGPDVASALVTKAGCPVVAVPLRGEVAAVGSGPVVLCLDGDSAAEDSLRFAFEEADRCGRTLVVLHAINPRADQLAAATDRRDIAEITAGWREEFPDVPVTHVLAVNARAEAIVNASTGASMVVLGSPHRPNWSWLYSLARSVLKRVNCPLVVVPTHEPAPPEHVSPASTSTAFAAIPTY